MVVKPRKYVDSTEEDEMSVKFESYEDFLKKLTLENSTPGHFVYQSEEGIDAPPQFDINQVNQWTQVITDMALV